MNTFIRRGDIYYCYFGNNSDLLSERKPVLVIQSDEVNAKSPTAIVAAIIVGAEKRHLPTHVMFPEGVAFKSTSMVMLEQLRTVDKTELMHFTMCGCRMYAQLKKRQSTTPDAYSLILYGIPITKPINNYLRQQLL